MLSEVAFKEEHLKEAYSERRVKLWDYATGMFWMREAEGEVFYSDGHQAADEQVADIRIGNTAIAEEVLKSYV